MKTAPKRLTWKVLSMLGSLCFAVALVTHGQQSTPGANLTSKARVFVTDSTSWEISGGFGGSSSGFGGSVHGGARPQRAEIIKTFSERCPQVTITLKQEAADFIVILDHEGGKGVARKKDKVAVFERDGDSIFSDSTRSVGNAVKDACSAILEHPVSSRNDAPSGLQSARPMGTGSVQPSDASVKAGPPGPSERISTATVKSTPDGADITMDGKYVGSTPSSLKLSSGDHIIRVEKFGFVPWQRTITVSSGSDLTLNAVLEKTP